MSRFTTWSIPCSAFGLLTLGLLLGAVVALLVSRGRGREWQRASVWLAALVVLSGAGNFGTRLNYNAWYGGATHALLDATVTGIEQDRTDRMLAELKRLRDEYYRTYEGKARYDVHVQETMGRERGTGASGLRSVAAKVVGQLPQTSAPPRFYASVARPRFNAPVGSVSLVAAWARRPVNGNGSWHT